MDYIDLYNNIKELTVQKRYVSLSEIQPILDRLTQSGKVQVEGYSVLGKPIYLYTNGVGTKKVLLWSQMHGNESTTTKALLDLFNYLDSEQGKDLLEQYTFYILPMVNPDGAERWTRNNANDVDLNRDSQNLTQPESQILRRCLENIKPDLCFNLHDQRTIFGVDQTQKPATVSFLSPSYNPSKEVNATRAKAIQVIIAMNNCLQEYIPGMIGRFNDDFNINCIGDTAQAMGFPTILIEAGHYPADYQREETRKFVFFSLLEGLRTFNNFYETDLQILEYFNIPVNLVLFYDIICKKIEINYDNKELITNFAVQFKEVAIDGEIDFQAYIAQIGELDQYKGHIEYDFGGQPYLCEGVLVPEINQPANFWVGDKQIVNGKVVS